MQGFSPKGVYDEEAYKNLRQGIAVTLTHTKDMHETTTINDEEYMEFQVKVPIRDNSYHNDIPKKQITCYAKFAHLNDTKQYPCYLYDSNEVFVETDALCYQFDKNKDIMSIFCA